jgi:hypothetical protein
MNKFSTTSKSKAVLVAALACVILAGSTSALAINPKQVARVYNAVSFTGQCCFLWNESVSITEPAAVVPVIVTWSADIVINDEFYVGLSLNGRGCTAYGSREIPWAPVLKGSGILNATHQWIVFPSDGLVKGPNTFGLCGGGVNSSTDTITFGLSTLAVQISN